MEKRDKPTVLLISLFVVVLLLFVGGVYLGLYLANNLGGIREVTITNLTSNAATVSWVTDDYAKGNVIYSQDNNWQPLFLSSIGKNQSFDDRDVVQISDGSFQLKDGNEKERKTHHVTLRNLQPNTTYYFRVGNNNKFVDAEVKSFTTYSPLEEIRTPNPIYQSVGNFVEDEPEPQEGIIYYYIYSKDDKSIRSNLRSSILNGENSNWTGDIGLLLGGDGQFFSYNIDNFRINTFAKTDVGYGAGDYDLDEYQPLPTLQVNVRYVDEN